MIGVCRIALLTAGLLLPAAAASAPATTPEPAAALPPARTLEQAIQIALEQNQGLKLKREAVQHAQAHHSEVRAAGWPRIDAESAYVRTGPVPSVMFPGPTGPIAIDLGVPETTTARLSLTQPIDISRLISTGVEVSELNLVVSRLELSREEQRVTSAVKQAYFGVLQGEAFRDVSQEALNAVEEHLKIARLHYEAGTVPHLDVLRAEVAVADARQRLVTATNAVDLAKAALNNVLGVDVNQPVEVEPPPGFPPLKLDLADLLAEAERCRLDLQVMDLRTEMARRGVRLARQGRLPRMALTGSYDWMEETSEFGPENLTWAVTLGVALPLFDGGGTSARIAQARSDVRSAETGREQLRQGIALEVRQAYLSLQEAQARLQATAKSVEEAREVLRLAHARYDTGVGTSVEVTDAVTAMTGGRSNYVNAVYDCQTSLAMAEEAVGGDISEQQRNGLK